jgi:hypothetical protein
MNVKGPFTATVVIEGPFKVESEPCKIEGK